jgi:hypothetical protein
MEGDQVSIKCTLKFDRVGGHWALDSSKRIVNIASVISSFGHYIHLRQIVGTTPESLQIIHDVTIRGFLYIINRSTTGTITLGKFGETFMFMLKPTELMLIRVQLFTLMVVSTEVDTPIDLFLLQEM